MSDDDYSDSEYTGYGPDFSGLGPGYGPPSIFNVSRGTGLETGCVICSKKDNLSRCSACKVVSYCGRGHQALDRLAHKACCKELKKAYATFDDEDAKLRAQPGDQFWPGNPLENEDAIGHFWGLIETRDYMRARYGVVDAQLKFNTRVAIQTALDHLLDMMRLCRGDNMGLRYSIPALFLRLGKEQECYDFCKWYATTGSEGDYDWGDMTLPFLDIKNADVFEPVDHWTGDFPDLSHTIAVALLKVRLLVDLQALERAKEQAGPHVPQEILDTIRRDAVNSSVVASNREILDRDDQKPHIKALETQVRQLFDTVNKENKYFWPALVKPSRRDLTARPNYHSRGTVKEMQLRLQSWYNAWVETPGAIGVIEELSKTRA